MYSDRVDSVTRATNPSLFTEPPSTLVSLPPFSTPISFITIITTTNQPRLLSQMHRRIKHGLAVRSSLLFVVSLFPSSSRHLLSFSFVVSSRSPRSRSIFLLLIPLRRISVRCLFFFLLFCHLILAYLSLFLTLTLIFFFLSFLDLVFPLFKQ